LGVVPSPGVVHYQCMRPVAHTVIDSIKVPMVQVFELLSDPTRIHQWLPGCTGVQCDVPFKKGARFTAHFGPRVTQFEIVDFAPPATFGWVEHGGRTGWKTFFHLEGTGGSTALTVRDLWIPQTFGAWLRGRFFEKRKVERQLYGIVENLRRLLTR
jgi:uncharacterized protein YndB with AHSA1/START domain